MAGFIIGQGTMEAVWEAFAILVSEDLVMRDYQSIFDNIASFNRFWAHVCQENQIWGIRVIVREPWFLAVAQLCQLGFEKINKPMVRERSDVRMVYNISSEYAAMLLKVVMSEWAVDYLKSDSLVINYLICLPFQELNADDDRKHSKELYQAIRAHVLLIAAVDKFHPKLWSPFKANCDIKLDYEFVQQALSGMSLPQQKRWTLPPFYLPVQLMKNEFIKRGDAQWTVGAWLLAIWQSGQKKTRIPKELEAELKLPLAECNTWLTHFGWQMQKERSRGQWLKALDPKRYSIVFQLQEEGSGEKYEPSQVEAEIIEWFADKRPGVDAKQMIKNGWDNWAAFLNLTESELILHSKGDKANDLTEIPQDEAEKRDSNRAEISPEEISRLRAENEKLQEENRRLRAENEKLQEENMRLREEKKRE